MPQLPFRTQSQLDYAAQKRENQQMRGDYATLHQFTAIFDISGYRGVEFYFRADGRKHAVEVFQRFLNETVWFEVPCRPQETPIHTRSSDVRNFKIVEGWPPEVETWPAVQDLNGVA